MQELPAARAAFLDRAAPQLAEIADQILFTRAWVDD
jgi:hypothetical protein